MMPILQVPSRRAMLCIAQRQQQLSRPLKASLSVVRLPIERSLSHQKITLYWQQQKCFSLDTLSENDTIRNTNKQTNIVGIEDREERLLKMLASSQTLSQKDDIIKEFQAILLYYCNKIIVRVAHKNNMKSGDTAPTENKVMEVAAQNICKWTKEMLLYQQRNHQGSSLISCCSQIPMEPIVEALRSTQQVTFLTFADDLVLKLADALSHIREPKEVLPENITKLLSCLITGWSKCDSNYSTDFEPAEKAEQWLLDWVRSYYHLTKNTVEQPQVKHGGIEVVAEFPNILLFGAVVDAWAKSRKREAPFRAERILNLLLFFANNSNDNDLSRQQQQVVMALLQEREPVFDSTMLFRNQHQTKKYVVPQPNTVLYTSIIDAWSRSSHPMAATFAEKWLHHMEKEYFEKGNTLARPNIVSYTAVISAFSRCSSYYPQEDNKSKSLPHAANRAESVLLRLLQLSSRERNNDSTMNDDDVLNLQQRQQLIRDVFAYNSVISAWANMVGKDPHATKNCERWLNTMIEGGAEADAVSFNSVINAFAREAIYNGSSSCSRAEYWFTEMKSRGIEPTMITYGSLIKAWSNSKSPDAPERAELWLQAYHQQQEKQHPNGEGQQQDAIVVYNSVLNSWVTSGRPDALDGAIRLISRMEESPPESKFVPPPDVVTYNTLLKGCSTIGTTKTSKGKSKANVGRTQTKASEKALRVAFKTYNKMFQSSSMFSNCSRRVQPDSHTFSIILTCISRLTPITEKKTNKAYKDIIAKIFRDCCSRGMVNDVVLSALKNACSCLPEEEGSRGFYTELTTVSNNDSTDIRRGSTREDESHTIPFQWKVNVSTGGGRSHGAPTERAMLLSRQKKIALRDSKL